MVAEQSQSEKLSVKGIVALHPWNLTWNLKTAQLKRIIIFQTSILGFHVNFQGCNSLLIPTRNTLGNYHLNMAMTGPWLKLLVDRPNMSVTCFFKLHKQPQFSATYRIHKGKFKRAGFLKFCIFKLHILRNSLEGPLQTLDLFNCWPFLSFQSAEVRFHPQLRAKGSHKCSPRQFWEVPL